MTTAAGIATKLQKWRDKLKSYHFDSVAGIDNAELLADILTAEQAIDDAKHMVKLAGATPTDKPKVGKDRL